MYWGALRNAGTAKVADMVKDAMLNPDVAKAYVMKASKKANAGSELSLATQLRRLSVFAPHGGVIGQAAQ